jgi:hypothetical protein
MGEGGFLDDDWLEAQRNLWAEWSARVGQTDAAGEPSTNPLEQILDQCWQALAPAAPPAIREMLEKTLTQGHQLFQLAAQFARARQDEAGAPDWQSAVEHAFGDLRGIIAGLTGTMNPIPEALLSETAIDSSRTYMERLFALPGLGPGQRSQTQQREMVARVLRYQQARLAYDSFLIELGNQSVSRLQAEVAALDGRGERIDTARGLYDLWVSVCEAVYAEQAMTADYVKLYGELINSQMAVKQQMRDMLDESFTALGMPTTRDIRALEQRAHQDRQAIRSLRAELTALRQAPAARSRRTRKKASSTGK